MKIVLFGPAYPFRGGVPHFTNALKLALEQAGHSAPVVNFKELQLPLVGGRPVYDDSVFAQRIESERVFTPWDPRTWKETARAIERHAPDLILASWWLPAHAPGYRAVFRALPFALREQWHYLIHDVLPHEPQPGDAWLARHALGDALQFITLSRAQAWELRKLLPELSPQAVHTLPHPLFESYAPFAGTPEEARRKLGVEAPRVLLFFGFIKPYKGLDLLLRAMPSILGDHPGLKLLVCGPFHESRSSYEKQMAELGITGSVVIHDRYFSGEESSLCFAAADAVVLPYRSATQTGVAPLAYALGVPVISTLVGGLSEVVRDGVTGIAIAAPEPAAIAEAVRTFYAAGGRAAFADGLRAEAAHYTWDAFIKGLIATTVR